ncbi:hypothetical protein DPMN_038240 [Dreissena polymorpha]|uniref:Uncharacterized protein n=1 Tax=Dreissena polymorpha TaxID=45954 RepID=A0A9D4RQJ7_DREPO|nr:hypothetical protein DPMN_038240 [Dreissena polymorpha]
MTTVLRNYLFHTGTAIRPDALFDKRLLHHHLAGEITETSLHEAKLILKRSLGTLKPSLE